MTAQSNISFASQTFRIAALKGVDAGGMLALFASVFSENPGLAWYKWKYACGGGMAIGFWDGQSTLMAHYGGLPRQLLFKGDVLPSLQIGDVMVAQHLRGVLTRRGPFFQVCFRFFADHVGLDRPYALAFGFPNERALQLGVALGFYHDVGSVRLVTWPSAKSKLSVGWVWRELVTPDDRDQAVRRTWQAMRTELTDCVVGKRDPRYVAWRFCDRPDRKYRLFALRRWPFGKIVSVVVLRLDPGRAELMDMIGKREFFGLAIRASANEAAIVGAATLSAWASSLAAEVFHQFDGTDAGKVAGLAVAKASIKSETELAATPWWLTGGDTDFL